MWLYLSHKVQFVETTCVDRIGISELLFSSNLRHNCILHATVTLPRHMIDLHFPCLIHNENQYYPISRFWVPGVIFVSSDNQMQNILIPFTSVKCLICLV